MKDFDILYFISGIERASNKKVVDFDYETKSYHFHGYQSDDILMSDIAQKHKRNLLIACSTPLILIFAGVSNIKSFLGVSFDELITIELLAFFSLIISLYEFYMFHTTSDESIKKYFNKFSDTKDMSSIEVFNRSILYITEQIHQGNTEAAIKSTQQKFIVYEREIELLDLRIKALESVQQGLRDLINKAPSSELQSGSSRVGQHVVNPKDSIHINSQKLDPIIEQLRNIISSIKIENTPNQYMQILEMHYEKIRDNQEK